MVSKQYISALDIGTSKVIALIGEIGEDNEIHIVGLGQAPSRGLRAGMVTNIDATAQAIKQAMDEAQLMADCRVNSVTTGIAGNHIRSLNSQGVVKIKDGEVSQADIDRAIETAKAVNIPPDHNILHTVVQEYIIDNQPGVKEPIGMSGVRLDTRVHIITGAITALQNIQKCVNRCGLHMDQIMLQPLASGQAVLTEDEKELGVCVIDIGGGTTDIAVLSLGGKVKATSVRVAGNHYDDEILKHVRNKFSIAIGQRTAEQLKKNVACCPQKADFDETMEVKGRSLLTGLPIKVNVSTSDLYEPVMMLSEQIGTAAHQVLEKTPPELAGDIFRNGVVLTGGGAQLHGLPEYLSQELKVDVTVSPDPVNCVALGTAMSLGLNDKLETGFLDATPRMGRR